MGSKHVDSSHGYTPINPQTPVNSSEKTLILANKSSAIDANSDTTALTCSSASLATMSHNKHCHTIDHHTHTSTDERAISGENGTVKIATPVVDPIAQPGDKPTNNLSTSPKTSCRRNKLRTCSETEATFARQTHHLVCTDTVESLMQPVQASTRIKYECISVSKNYIALGTNTGFVYVFSRVTLRRIYIIPAETGGSIAQVALNKFGNLIAYGTSKGHVLVSRLYPESSGKPDRVRAVYEHVGYHVLALKWNETSEHLYIGDHQGRVTVVYFISHKAKNALGLQSQVILRLRSAVVQIDTKNDKLLVSTRTSTILCDHIKHQYSQIGKRPREGRFGSCFAIESQAGQTDFIYCSRPGSRIWAVDREATVLTTHQFKHLLDTPPTPIFNLNAWGEQDFTSLPGPGQQSVAFPKLLPCGDQYLLSWTAKGVVILEPQEVKLVLWNHQTTDVEDICCHGNEIYLLKTCGDIQRLELQTVRQLWTRLLHNKKFIAAGWLVSTHRMLTDIPNGVCPQVIHELASKVTEDKLKRVLQNLADEIEVREGEKTNVNMQKLLYEKLDSGIFKIYPKHNDSSIQCLFGNKDDQLYRCAVGVNDTTQRNVEEKEMSEDICNQEVRTARARLTRRKSCESITESVTLRDLMLSEETNLDITCDADVLIVPVNNEICSTTIAENMTDFNIEGLEQTKEELRQNSENAQLILDTSTTTSQILERRVRPEVLIKNETSHDTASSIFFNVKERISSRVKSTTRSVIENLKEKKAQLTRIVSVPEEKMDELPTSSIDTTKLIQATEVCRKQMDDPMIAFNPIRVRQALTSWVNELNQTMLDFYTTALGSSDKPQKYDDDLPEGRTSITEDPKQSDKVEDDNYGINTVKISDTPEDLGHVLIERNIGDTNLKPSIISQHVNNNKNLNSDISYGNYCDDLIYTTDPFNLPQAVFEDVSDLARLCMSFSCYGNILALEHWHRNVNRNICDLKNLLSENSGILTKMSDDSVENKEDQKTDKDKLIMFLHCYFSFLSQDSRQVYDIITRDQGTVRFERWKSFVGCLLSQTTADIVTQHILNKEVERAIDIIRSEVSKRGITTLAYIVRLYGMAPLHTLTFCEEISAHIPILDVYFLTHMGSRVTEHFLPFICRRLNKIVDPQEWESTMEYIFNDVELRDIVLTCLLQAPRNKQHSCNCGLPCPGTHLRPRPNEELLKRILFNRRGCVTEVKDICREHGYWKGVIGLCNHEGNLKESRDLLQIIVLQLCDVKLLTKDCDAGYFPQSIVEWEMLLSRRSAQRYVYRTQSGMDGVACLGCSQPLRDQISEPSKCNEFLTVMDETNTLPEAEQQTIQRMTDIQNPPSDETSCWKPDITWEKLATLLVLDVGLHRGIDMLRHVDIPNGALPVSFFASCVGAASIRSYQSDLTHNMLDNVNTYLWSVRPDTMAPEIAMAVIMEKLNNLTLPEPDKEFEHLRCVTNFTESHEDAGTKWGVGIDLSVPCAACGVALQTCIDLKQTGALFYKCGHGLHLVCSSETSCDVCSNHDSKL